MSLLPKKPSSLSKKQWDKMTDWQKTLFKECFKMFSNCCLYPIGFNEKYIPVIAHNLAFTLATGVYEIVNKKRGELK